MVEGQRLGTEGFRAFAAPEPPHDHTRTSENPHSRPLLAAQIAASSEEVTLDSRYCWGHTRMGLHSGLGIILDCSLLGRVCLHWTLPELK